jgi:hypothetical protein
VVGLVIGEVSLEEMEVVVDVADQAGLARHQEEGTEAAGTEALNPISQFVMDVGGGDHGLITFRTGAILDAIENPSLAFPENLAVPLLGLVAVAFCGFLGESSSHSKASAVWNSEDVFSPRLFQ